MKKYNVEIRENMMNCWDNPVCDHTEAESEEEAIELTKDWMIEHGWNPEEVDNLMFRASELKAWDAE